MINQMLPAVKDGRRLGLVPYKIRVHTEERYNDYMVLATRAIDARIIAFALDGGLHGDTEIDDGLVELAITWTELIG